jgi:Tfp pilus assembly protein PilF
MEGMLKPIRVLREDAAWFARATEIKGWHVATSADLGAAVKQVASAQECHADNKSLFFEFEEPFLLSKSGWHSRAERLRAEYTRKQEALTEEGIKVRGLNTSPNAPAPTSELAEFTAVLQEVVGALVEPLVGVVIVLAPVQVEASEPLLIELRQLMASTALSRVRWVFIERGQRDLRPLVEELGERGLLSECVQDEKETKKDFAALAGPPDLALSWPTGPRPWRPPGAGPDVAAPPRKNAMPPPTDEQLRAQGLSPLYVNGGGEQLRSLQLNSALAASDGRYGDAVRLQSAAADLCGHMEMPREQATSTMVLASYWSAAGQPDQARASYERASTIAEQNGLLDQVANAKLGMGMLAASEGQHRVAMGHYSAAGQVAEESGNHVLAIECWRTAGRLAYDVQALDAAQDAWTRALGVAAKLTPKQAQGTSAAEVARGLAAIHRTRGAEQDATRFEARAFAFEHGLAANHDIAQA